MSRPARVLVWLIEIYRSAISPLRPPSCRYTPTCSAYAVEAVRRFGLARGSRLALRRLLRCHPLHAGGHDPVPLGVGRGVARSRARAVLDNNDGASSRPASVVRSAGEEFSSA